MGAISRQATQLLKNSLQTRWIWSQWDPVIESHLPCTRKLKSSIAKHRNLKTRATLLKVSSNVARSSSPSHSNTRKWRGNLTLRKRLLFSSARKPYLSLRWKTCPLQRSRNSTSSLRGALAERRISTYRVCLVSYSTLRTFSVGSARPSSSSNTMNR